MASFPQVTTVSPDPRIRFTCTFPPRKIEHPATSFSTQMSGIDNGDRIYPGFVHAPSHRNVFHGPGGVPQVGDDPTRVWAHPIEVYRGSTADKKPKGPRKTSGALALNRNSPNGVWGWFSDAWHPAIYDRRQGYGHSVYYRQGSSSYYVAPVDAIKRELYLEAPPNGTGLIMRPMTGGGGDSRGLKWDDKTKGTARCRWHGPKWLRRGHPLGVPLGAPGLEEWVHWGDDAPQDGYEWYPIPEQQLVVKFSIKGLRSLDDIGFGGVGVPSHAEYVYNASPMPTDRDPDGPTLLQILMDLGCNWGHPRNVFPDGRGGYEPRKAEGVKISITEQFHFPLDPPAGHIPPGPPEAPADPPDIIDEVPPVDTNPTEGVDTSPVDDNDDPDTPPADIEQIEAERDEIVAELNNRLTATRLALSGVSNHATAADALIGKIDQLANEGLNA